MLLQHAGWYVLARGLPGIVNFAALSVYTHWLAPAEYGRYALGLATAGLASALAFQWIQVALLRFLPRHAGQEARLLSNVCAAFGVAMAVTACMGALGYALYPEGPWAHMLPLVMALLWVQAWFELNLQLFSSRLQPVRYGAASGLRAVLALGVGGLLAWLGWGAFGPLSGLLVGGLCSTLFFAGSAWRVVSRVHVDRAVLRELAAYGLPLGFAFALSFVISTSDRYLIAWLMDEPAVGLYAIACDLAQCSLGVLMVTINLAAYPLVLQILEREGVAAAAPQLERQCLLLLAVAAPATVGMALLADNIATVLLGAGFQSTAAAILPWIACAGLLAGLKAFYFDLAFQLGRHTLGQVRIVVFAGLVNVLLNLAWIPEEGLVGAARASLVAYGFGLAMSAWLGRAYFRLPLPVAAGARIMVAVALMALVLLQVRHHLGLPALLGQVLLGGTCYGMLLWFLNPGNLRVMLQKSAGRR